LTQIASHPRYARAYRIGSAALRIGVAGTPGPDVGQLTQTYGVYEAWCFAVLATLLARATGSNFAPPARPVASSDIALEFACQDGRFIQLLFQANFPSEKPFAAFPAWSLSKQRYPDIVVACINKGATEAFVVLDAKYRAGRDNELDAMESAHIYHDALRLGKDRPSLCLLLLPGNASARYLGSSHFWQAHNVGGISEYRPGGEGLQRVLAVLSARLGVNLNHSNQANV
jgi:hypothetical protein